MEKWVRGRGGVAQTQLLLTDGQHSLLLQLCRVTGAPLHHVVHGAGVEPAREDGGGGGRVARGSLLPLGAAFAHGALNSLPAHGRLEGGWEEEGGGEEGGGVKCEAAAAGSHQRVPTFLQRLWCHLAEGEAQRLHRAAAAQAVAAVRAAAGVHCAWRIAAQSAGWRRDMARGLERVVGMRLAGGGNEVLQQAAAVRAQQAQVLDERARPLPLVEGSPNRPGEEGARPRVGEWREREALFEVFGVA